MNAPSRTEATLVCGKAADLLLRYPWKLWFWGDSIGMEGLLDATELVGSEKYLNYVYGVFKGWMPRMRAVSKFEHTAPGVALLRTYLATRDETLLEAARKHAAYLDTFRRTVAGCPVHYEDVVLEMPPELPRDHPSYGTPAAGSPADGGPCVFVDSIHFQGPFLAMLYSITGETAYLSAAEGTIGPQVELLWDEEQRLFHHFWMERSGRRNGVFWGRGNGWALLGMLHTVEYLPPGRALRDRFLEILTKLVARLAELQDASGDWHTVLTEQDSYLEPSVAAFVVDGFGLAIRKGWVSPDYTSVVEKAWRAMWSHQSPEGLLKGVSFETHPSTSSAHYRTMPTGAMVPWGQGPFLTACRSYLTSTLASP